MSHTEQGVKRHNIRKNAKVHQGFMSGMVRKSQHKHQQVQQKQREPQVKLVNTKQTLQRQGGMFGLRRR